MARTKRNKTAGEILEQFISNLGNLEGMDQDIAIIIQSLWKEGKLGRDELWSELERVRTRGGNV